MLIISTRPAIAAAIAATYAAHEPVRVCAPGDIGPDHVEEIILFDAVGMPRAFDRLNELGANLPHAQLILLISRPSDLAAQLARRCGARAVLSDSDGPRAWTNAFARLSCAEFIAGPAFSGAPVICSRLTARQVDVYLLAILGLTDEEIGAQLGIAVATAETHRRDIQNRLACAGHRELIAHALCHGLIDACDIVLNPPLRRTTRRHVRESAII